MIFYATKETLGRYKLKTPDQMSEPIRPFIKAIIEREQGNSIYEGGYYPFSTKESGKEEWHIPYSYFAEVIKEAFC